MFRAETYDGSSSISKSSARQRYFLILKCQDTKELNLETVLRAGGQSQERVLGVLPFTRHAQSWQLPGHGKWLRGRVGSVA